MNILVAEDDPISRMVLQRTLERQGHQVNMAADGDQAWKTFQKERPPLIITDWMMPGTDGLELCRRIRAEGGKKYTYVIMLTAIGSKEGFMQGMDAGADDFLTKPCDPDQLNARIRVAERILNLQTEVNNLQELLPICSYCKRIRDDRDAWVPLEDYMLSRTETTFSHGICPQCWESQVKPELDQWRREH